MLSSDLDCTTLLHMCVGYAHTLHKEARTRMSAAIQVVLLTARDTKVSTNKE